MNGVAQMIRTSVLLCALIIGGVASAEPIQQLQRDTASPSVIDLSNGERSQWREPERDRGGSPGVYGGGGSSAQGGGSSGAPRTQAVSGYTRKDGTYVAPYMRSVRRR